MSTSARAMGSGRVEAAHGSGGRATHELVQGVFLSAFDNPALRTLDDGARLNLPPGEVVVSTDSHVVTPLFFPGGDIGALSVNGTVNDVAMMGARPLHLTCGFILEEGFALADLQRVVDSMAGAAADAGVSIVAGDTKVVDAGSADGMFITTTGVGVIPHGVEVGRTAPRPGDAVLVSGTMGDHGIAIMSKRQHLNFGTTLESDTASLAQLVEEMIQKAPRSIRMMRDPTRGGLAAVANEIAQAHGVGLSLQEDAIPLRSEVVSACELLGLDPLYVANEGKLVAICSPEAVEPLLEVMRKNPLGCEAACIGHVIEDPMRLVQLRTPYGSSRLIDYLAGDQLPRIC